MESILEENIDFEKIFAEISNVRVAVVGDVMLDTYWWGNTQRVTAETPVPVVTLATKEYRIGGAGNVALNTTSMGAETTLFSVIGEDEDAETLLNLLQEQHIDTKYIVRSSERITTNKIRLMSEHNQEVVRIDQEVTYDILKDDEERLLHSFTGFVKRYTPSVVIFEDYNKGVLTETLIGKLIAVCQEHNIITTADPKKNNFFAYKGITIFKPDLKEAAENVGVTLDGLEDEHLTLLHQALNAQLGHKISIITLPDFSLFFQKGSYHKMVPGYAQQVTDAKGAGTTLVAVSSLVYAITKDISVATSIANLAAGIVCETIGTIAINKEQLLSRCADLQPVA